ncbi:MAG: outer membrane beta-barrel protein [Xanthobacteraceae bacterium]
MKKTPLGKATRLGSAGFSLLAMAASVSAADLGVPPAPPMLTPFSWTGCYAGGHVGGAWGQKDLTDVTGALAPITGFTSANLGTSGYVVGGQIGCDYQFASSWVVGVEGAVSGTNIGSSTAVAQPLGIAGDSAAFQETTDLLTTATARVGYAWDHWLLYAKGGAAWASDKYTAIGVFLGTPYDLVGLETRMGWTAGGGLEWALSNDWSIKLEYDYYGFGSRSVTFIDATTGNTGPENIKQSIQVVKLGLNFHVFAGP